MKKLFVLLMVSMMLVSIISTGVAAADESYHFILIPKLVHPWYEDVIDGMERAVKEFKERGIEINAEWIAPQQASVPLHVQKIETAIAKNPDGLAVSSLDPSADTPAINEAIRQGISTITFDNDAPDSNREAFVGIPQNEPNGRKMAKALAEKLDYEGEVAILVGSLGSLQHKQRVRGFKEEMAKYEDIKIVDELVDNDNLEKAMKLASDAIKANPGLDGFYGADATAPIGAARAVENAGKQGEIWVVGQDDLPDMVRYMRKDIVWAMDVQRPFDMGYWSVYYLYALNSGHDAPALFNQSHTIPELHNTGSFVITADKLSEYDKYKSKEYQMKK